MGQTRPQRFTLALDDDDLKPLLRRSAPIRSLKSDSVAAQVQSALLSSGSSLDKCVDLDGQPLADGGEEALYYLSNGTALGKLVLELLLGGITRVQLLAG